MQDRVAHKRGCWWHILLISFPNNFSFYNNRWFNSKHKQATWGKYLVWTFQFHAFQSMWFIIWETSFIDFLFPKTFSVNTLFADNSVTFFGISLVLRSLPNNCKLFITIASLSMKSKHIGTFYVWSCYMTSFVFDDDYMSSFMVRWYV